MRSPLRPWTFPPPRFDKGFRHLVPKIPRCAYFDKSKRKDIFQRIFVVFGSILSIFLVQDWIQ